MRHQSLQPRSHALRGFTLIEALIAIVVLSFGVLGAVGMQLAALQAIRDSRNQSVAVRLAREAAELVRDNKAVALQNNASLNPYLLSFSGNTLPAAASENCFAIACTTAKSVAEYSIREWLGRVSTELPGATVKICFDSAPYDVQGLPRWACTDTGTLMMVKLGWTRPGTDRSAVGAAALDSATRPSVVLATTTGAGV